MITEVEALRKARATIREEEEELSLESSASPPASAFATTYCDSDLVVVMPDGDKTNLHYGHHQQHRSINPDHDGHQPHYKRSRRRTLEMMSANNNNDDDDDSDSSHRLDSMTSATALMAANTLANWSSPAPLSSTSGTGSDIDVLDASSNPCNTSSAIHDLSGHHHHHHLKRKDVFNARKQREFIPDNKKDESYWDRRRRNNEAAKRSREKRRLNDMVLESRVFELTKENTYLRAQLMAIREKYGIVGENLVTADQLSAAAASVVALPASCSSGGSENHQVALNLTKRAKLLSPSTTVNGHGSSSPMLTTTANGASAQQLHLQHQQSSSLALRSLVMASSANHLHQQQPASRPSPTAILSSNGAAPLMANAKSITNGPINRQDYGDHYWRVKSEEDIKHGHGHNATSYDVVADDDETDQLHQRHRHLLNGHHHEQLVDVHHHQSRRHVQVQQQSALSSPPSVTSSPALLGLALNGHSRGNAHGLHESPFMFGRCSEQHFASPVALSLTVDNNSSSRTEYQHQNQHGHDDRDKDQHLQHSSSSDRFVNDPGYHQPQRRGASVVTIVVGDNSSRDLDHFCSNESSDEDVVVRGHGQMRRYSNESSSYPPTMAASAVTSAAASSISVASASASSGDNLQQLHLPHKLRHKPRLSECSLSTAGGSPPLLLLPPSSVSPDVQMTPRQDDDDEDGDDDEEAMVVDSASRSIRLTAPSRRRKYSVFNPEAEAASAEHGRPSSATNASATTTTSLPAAAAAAAAASDDVTLSMSPPGSSASTASSSSSSRTTPPSSNLKVENSQLKQEMKRLAVEVANLKDMLIFNNKSKSNDKSSTSAGGSNKSDTSSRDSGFTTDGEPERERETTPT